MQEEACFLCGAHADAKHPIKYAGAQPKLCGACRSTPELISTIKRIFGLQSTEENIKRKLAENQARQSEVREAWMKLRSRYQRYVAERGASPFVPIDG